MKAPGVSGKIKKKVYVCLAIAYSLMAVAFLLLTGEPPFLRIGIGLGFFGGGVLLVVLLKILYPDKERYMVLPLLLSLVPLLCIRFFFVSRGGVMRPALIPYLELPVEVIDFFLYALYIIFALRLVQQKALRMKIPAMIFCAVSKASFFIDLAQNYRDHIAEDWFLFVVCLSAVFELVGWEIFLDSIPLEQRERPEEPSARKKYRKQLKRICPVCGCPVPKTSPFCPDCGTKCPISGAEELAEEVPGGTVPAEDVPDGAGATAEVPAEEALVEEVPAQKEPAVLGADWKEPEKPKFSYSTNKRYTMLIAFLLSFFFCLLAIYYKRKMMEFSLLFWFFLPFVCLILPFVVWAAWKIITANRGGRTRLMLPAIMISVLDYNCVFVNLLSREGDDGVDSFLIYFFSFVFFGTAILGAAIFTCFALKTGKEKMSFPAVILAIASKLGIIIVNLTRLSPWIILACAASAVFHLVCIIGALPTSPAPKADTPADTHSEE